MVEKQRYRDRGSGVNSVNSVKPLSVKPLSVKPLSGMNLGPKVLGNVKNINLKYFDRHLGRFERIKLEYN